VQVPDDLRYTADHEWLRVEGDEAVVGITAYAADQLGDVVFVELPATGTALEPAQSFGVIESVKTASDLYAPAGGEVVAINDALGDKPELVNDDPYGDGWMVRIRLSDPAAASADGGRLMGPDAYRQLTEAG
jgi:glycine cleavage system H protein